LFAFVALCCILLNKHSLLARLFNEKRDQQKVFGLMVRYGVSPYYYERFYHPPLNKRSYFSAICSSQNEYLLKRKLKKEGRVFVDKKWAWKRGEYISKKKGK